MIIPKQPPRYRVYLLRCWEERPAAPTNDDEIGTSEAEWRFSLEEVGSGERRRGFGSLKALMTFLRERMDE
jgi:hypothetical protein